MGENLVHLVPVEHDRQPLGLGRPFHSLEPADLFLQHLLV